MPLNITICCDMSLKQVLLCTINWETRRGAPHQELQSSPSRPGGWMWLVHSSDLTLADIIFMPPHVFMHMQVAFSPIQQKSSQIGAE